VCLEIVGVGRRNDMAWEGNEPYYQFGEVFFRRLLPPSFQKSHCRRKALLAPTNGHVFNCDYYQDL